ncbi:MAG: methyl-accepting chemotaxis protein [Burkholderiaceae bacterium]
MAAPAPHTPLPALTAAGGGARAGEQGRGFAVVAGEVRTLAVRAGSAAKDIRGLIGTSIERIEKGAGLVNAASQQMGDVVSQVQQVSGLVAEIDSACLQQANGIDEINIAMGQLDQTTQQNAAMVEQAAAAAQSLDQQALRLSTAVRVFKTASPRPMEHHVA